MDVIGVRFGPQGAVEGPVAGRFDKVPQPSPRVGVAVEVTAQDGATLRPAQFSELITH